MEFVGNSNQQNGSAKANLTLEKLLRHSAERKEKSHYANIQESDFVDNPREPFLIDDRAWAKAIPDPALFGREDFMSVQEGLFMNPGDKDCCTFLMEALYACGHFLICR